MRGGKWGKEEGGLEGRKKGGGELRVARDGIGRKGGGGG